MCLSLDASLWAIVTLFLLLKGKKCIVQHQNIIKKEDLHTRIILILHSTISSTKLIRVKRVFTTAIILYKLKMVFANCYSSSLIGSILYVSCSK
mmetsp:Transcript_3131/g.4296  ORF Transcript_3131/g.4296 Transcript_3131/m.4296 type:complete len:94 (-) Transcript_3131:48-329(-)